MLFRSALTQVRIREYVAIPEGAFGEVIEEQIRVLYQGRYEVWRRDAAAAGAWSVYLNGDTSLDTIPLVTVYSNRLGNLLSSPPLLEVAYLNISYAQRFCDYMHALHTGAMPILTMRGFDPDGDVGMVAGEHGRPKAKAVKGIHRRADVLAWCIAETDELARASLVD